MRLRARFPGLAPLILAVLPLVPASAADSKGEGEAKAPTAAIEPLPIAAYSVPIELVRTLQLLQDRIALGSTQAFIGQRALVQHAEERMLALQPETWAEQKNVRAAVTFALSGGGPGLMRHLVASGKAGDAETPLILGTLAYLEGREKEARTLLSKIDPNAVPVGLGAQLALAQAALAASVDPAQSVRLLDLARLLAPGTLVEEGALRREIFVLAQTGDLKRFEALAIQYLRRFRHSVYAGNFRQRFAAALTRLDFANDGARFAKLQAMLDEIEPEGRRDIYLLVARAGLDQGKTSTAVFAAERSITLADPASPFAVRARLYRAAALLAAEGHFDHSIETLRTTDRRVLADADLVLLDAALAMAAEIRSVPAAKAEATTTVPDSATPKRALPMPASIARAQGMIDRVDAMMNRSSR